MNIKGLVKTAKMPN